MCQIVRLRSGQATDFSLGKERQRSCKNGVEERQRAPCVSASRLIEETAPVRSMKEGRRRHFPSGRTIPSDAVRCGKRKWTGYQCICIYSMVVEQNDWEKSCAMEAHMKARSKFQPGREDDGRAHFWLANRQLRFSRKKSPSLGHKLFREASSHDPPSSFTNLALSPPRGQGRNRLGIAASSLSWLVYDNRASLS